MFSLIDGRGSEKHVPENHVEEKRNFVQNLFNRNRVNRVFGSGLAHRTFRGWCTLVDENTQCVQTCFYVKTLQNVFTLSATK